MMMEAGIRPGLDSSRLSTLPKQDTQRAVLQFVNSLRSFSRVHAAEGKPYMTSWNAQETFVESSPAEARNPRSSGFATPVLKPRVAPDKEPTQDETQERVAPSPKRPGPPSNFSSHVGAKPPGKAAKKTPSKEAFPRRGHRSVKRFREPDSDEERRLQERRGKKKTRREIMQSGASKKQAEDCGQSQGKPKSKKPRKMPTGLALMYGFTATNVGKSRLTVEPSFRPGVFGKGKASAQARVGQPKLKGQNFAFSEEEFLRSVTTGKHRHGKGESSAAPKSQSSRTSEYTDGEDLSRRRSKGNAFQPVRANLMAPLAQKGQKFKTSQDTATKDKTERRSSKSSPEKALSIVWDIEKDDGVLPTEAPSILTRGSKASTVQLNISQNRWLPDFSSNKTDVSSVQELSGQQKDITDDNHMAQRLVVEKEQDSTSSTSSIRPSESPSQVVLVPEPGTKPQETVSKYFAPILSLRVHSLGELTRETHGNPIVSASSLPPLAHECPETGSVESDDRRGPLQIVGKCEEPIVTVVPQNIAQSVQAHSRNAIDGSDWLLSDPVLSPMLNKSGDCGAELFHLEGSEEIQSCFDPDDTLSEGPVGLDQEEEEFYLPEGSEFDVHDSNRFMMPEDVLRDYLSVEGVDSENYEDNYPIFYSGVHVEKARSQPIPLKDLTERDGYEIQAINECDETSSLFSDRCPLSSIESSELVVDPAEDALTYCYSSNNLTRGPLLRFDEGRSLLWGAGGFQGTIDFGLDTIEADVARRLVGHWVPRRH